MSRVTIQVVMTPELRRLERKAGILAEARRNQRLSRDAVFEMVVEAAKAAHPEAIARSAEGIRFTRVPRKTLMMKILYRYAVDEWDKEVPRCRVPGCSARRSVRDQPLRSTRFSTDPADPSNAIPMCRYHRKLLRAGQIEAWGRADGIVYCRLGASLPRYYAGDLKVSAADIEARFPREPLS